MALDTQTATRRLTALGLEERVANGIADTIADATNDLATKEDIADLRSETKQDISDLRTEIARLEGKIEGLIGQLEAKFFRQLWFLGMGLIVAGTAILGIQAAILVALLG